MNNIILGSGIVGLLAKKILDAATSESWTVVPFYRSRFFSYNPALDDNFIIYSDKIDKCLKEIVGTQDIPLFFYRRGWSYQGSIFKSYDAGLFNLWSTKVFGSEVPSQLSLYFDGKMDLTIYNLRTNELYQGLMNSILADLKTEAAKGQVTEVGDHYIIRNGVREDFDNCVSTIPLHKMFELTHTTGDLPSRTLHYLCVQTEELNFEGCNQLLVADAAFPFYKATNFAPGKYLLYCQEEITNPGAYLMSMFSKFDILDGTTIQNALPMGETPNLSALEAKGVYSVGSYAQWDWCMDAGSCIIRLLGYAQRDFKPQQKKSL